MGTFYIAASILILFVIMFFLVRSGKSMKSRKLSNLAKLAFFLVVVGILFGENRFIGYTLLGSGVLFALLDIREKLKA